MTDINRFTVVGAVGWDPELRYTNNGKPVCTAKIKTVHEGKSTTVEITLWEEMAESYAQLKRGDRVEIFGHIGVEKIEATRNGKSFERWIPSLKADWVAPEGTYQRQKGQPSKAPPPRDQKPAQRPQAQRPVDEHAYQRDDGTVVEPGDPDRDIPF